MYGQNRHVLYEQTILPHLDAAYNLARWLLRNDQDAEDVVQDSCLRAFKFLNGFRGGDGRAWLLAIVRNTCYTRLRNNRARDLTLPLDPEIHDSPCDDANPETILLRNMDLQQLRRALDELPTEAREIIVLRDLEGLAYKEIAQIADLPMGTVMSRLARARKRLQQCLNHCAEKES